MKFMLMRKADEETEKGTLPSAEVLQAMHAYNERMIQAGIFLFGNGVRPTSEGCRIVFRNGEASVIRGPFSPTSDQLAGYSVLEVDSLEEAIDWARQWPREDSDGNTTLELRRYFELSDFNLDAALTDKHQRQMQLPMELNIHLSFPGNCREAMTFYQQVTGGVLEAMIPYAETPAATEVPAEQADRIIHASLNIRGRRLMAADMNGDCHQAMQGSCVHLEFDSLERAAEVFDQLQQGGQLIMPFEETFWAKRFGMTTDRFGTHWMIGYGTGHCPQALNTEEVNAP
ncbi:YciI family protein [Pseudomonas sp. MYb185]|uniref:YciI family protein n=1 Tax=Pseudomonas sp. MYb185 TaxID=1848729 RepID=UPI000CFDF68E|nr:YciI family protein [Pseudomonas sp. MYb185]PRB80193.1 hypothetical protein CQ007_13460 [Pseudomonas sp. MYb185]